MFEMTGKRNMSKILITGTSGLIGSELSKFLAGNGHKIIRLSRTNKEGEFKSFQWNIETGYLEQGALENVDHIIHLAGAGIANKRWTPIRKKEIIDSRVKSTELLYNSISKLDHKPKTFISASAIGYYGAITSEKIFLEDDSPGDDFVAQVCKKWEDAANQFSEIGIRTIKLRLGVVLSPNGGALKKMMLPTNFGLGSTLGSGKQYFPWIHITDLINIIEKCIIDSEMNGIYNLVSPTHVNYNRFAKTLAKVMKKPYFMPNVPSFLLKLIFGEMSQIILEVSRISPQKIIESGYAFNFTKLEDALEDLLMKKNR